MIFVCMPDGIVNIYLCTPKCTALLSNKQVKDTGRHVTLDSSAVFG